MSNPSLRLSLLFATLAAAGLAVCGQARAGAAEVVYQPVVENGELEFEYRGGWRQYAGGREEHGSIFEVGYGMNDHWFSEIELEQSFENGGPNRLESLEWENVFALTERGKYWMDFGIFAAYEHTFDPDDPDTITIGPMFMKDIGPVTANVNLLFKREVGRGASHDTGLGYAWQVRWHGRPSLEFGVQGLGDLGTFGHLGRDSSQIAGPALFGERHIGRSTLKWNAAVLAGLDRAAPNVTVRTQIELEMH